MGIGSEVFRAVRDKVDSGRILIKLGRGEVQQNYKWRCGDRRGCIRSVLTVILGDSRA